MSKFVKNLMTDDLKHRFDGVSSACVVDLTGLDVKSTETIRKRLRAKEARLRVVKNSLARRAFVGTALEPLSKELIGPSALVTSTGSMVDVAKALVELAREFNKLKLKQAVPEGETTIITVVELSKMRSRGELLGEIAMLIASPGRAIAGCIGSPGGKIAGCLKAMADKADSAEKAA